MRGRVYGALELAASGVDVAAAGATDVGGQAGGDEGLLEADDVGGVGLSVEDAGAGVPDDKVDFGGPVAEGRGGAAEEVEDLAGVLRLVVDAAEQDVLEGDPLAGAEGDGAAGLKQGGDVPLAGNGHDLRADGVI